MSDFSILSPEECSLSDNESESLRNTQFVEMNSDLFVCADNSTIPLRKKIEDLKNENFDPRAKIMASEVLKKSIRNTAVQELNIDTDKRGKSTKKIVRVWGTIIESYENSFLNRLFCIEFLAV